jgi:hypothetical protein
MFNIYKLNSGEWLGVIEQPCYSCHYEEYIFNLLDLIFEELNIKDKPVLKMYLNDAEPVCEAFDKVTFILPQTISEEKIRYVRKKYHTMQTIDEVLENIFGKKK